jgi:hypothetical protein
MNPTPLSQVPEHLRSTVALLQAAYPDGLSGDDYEAVLRILGEHMSQRALAKAVGHYRGQHYALILHDVFGSQSPPDVVPPPPGEVFDRVKQRLASAGFNDWLNEVESPD